MFGLRETCSVWKIIIYRLCHTEDTVLFMKQYGKITKRPSQLKGCRHTAIRPEVLVEYRTADSGSA